MTNRCLTSGGGQMQDDISVDMTFKILVLGDSSVGKTCLTCRFCEKTYIGLDCMQRVVTLDGKKIQLHIWDTAGQERYRTLTTAYYRGAMGILLLYDVTNEASFNSVTGWLENISQNTTTNVFKVLIGNKCDSEENRRVSTMRAINLASSFDLMFYETSAKLTVNVEPAFMALVKQILTHQQQRLKFLQTSQPEKVIRGSRLECLKKNEKSLCGC